MPKGFSLSAVDQYVLSPPEDANPKKGKHEYKSIVRAGVYAWQCVNCGKCRPYPSRADESECPSAKGTP